MRVAEYSRDCLRELRAETGIHYEHRTQGTLQLFRTQAQLDAVQPMSPVLQECGVRYELLDRSQLATVEPALAHTGDLLAGGLRLPNDETGDCNLFTRGSGRHRARARRELPFRTKGGWPDHRGRPHHGRSPGWCVPRSVDCRPLRARLRQLFARFDAPLGLDIPVYPVKGYSLTVPLVDPSAAPQSTVLDETYKVAVTRFDDRIRVGGMAELGGFDLRLNPRRRETLERVITDLFPCGDLPRATFWTGLRPMTPDSTAHRRRDAVRQLCTSTLGTARWVGPWLAGRARWWRTK